jgi:hypothetical protein
MQKKKIKKTYKAEKSRPYTLRATPSSLAIKAIKISIFLIAGVLVYFTLPRPALADPHAMFYTDRAQEQLFYNVLAALNQADYVEAPVSVNSSGQVDPPTLGQAQPTSPPQIDYNTRIGNYLASGTYTPRQGQRTATVNRDGSITVGESGTPTALEPQERTNLPRIAVRQVTSDNGDAFLRESLQRRALAEQMRVEIAGISCRILEGIYGPQAVKDPNNSQANSNNGISPCDEYLKGDSLIFAQ